MAYHLRRLLGVVLEHYQDPDHRVKEERNQTYPSAGPSVATTLRRALRTNQSPCTPVSNVLGPVQFRAKRAHEKTASEPEEGRQEGKGDGRLPTLTGALLGDVAPREDAPAVERTDEVDEQAEGDHPEHEQDEVGDVVQKAGGGRDEPEERHEDGDGGDDLRVEEAALGPRVGAVVVGMEVGPDQAGHGL